MPKLSKAIALLKKKAQPRRKPKLIKPADSSSSFEDVRYWDRNTSFQKLLDNRKELRKNKFIRAEIRASFNRDSSLEASQIEDGTAQAPKQSTLTKPTNTGSNVVLNSTPIRTADLHNVYFPVSPIEKTTKQLERRVPQIFEITHYDQGSDSDVEHLQSKRLRINSNPRQYIPAAARDAAELVDFKIGLANLQHASNKLIRSSLTAADSVLSHIDTSSLILLRIAPAPALVASLCKESTGNGNDCAVVAKSFSSLTNCISHDTQNAPQIVQFVEHSVASLRKSRRPLTRSVNRSANSSSDLSDFQLIRRNHTEDSIENVTKLENSSNCLLVNQDKSVRASRLSRRPLTKSQTADCSSSQDNTTDLSDVPLVNLITKRNSSKNAIRSFQASCSSLEVIPDAFYRSSRFTESIVAASNGLDAVVNLRKQRHRSATNASSGIVNRKQSRNSVTERRMVQLDCQRIVSNSSNTTTDSSQNGVVKRKRKRIATRLQSKSSDVENSESSSTASYQNTSDEPPQIDSLTNSPPQHSVSMLCNSIVPPHHHTRLDKSMVHECSEPSPLMLSVPEKPLDAVFARQPIARRTRLQARSQRTDTSSDSSSHTGSLPKRKTRQTRAKSSSNSSAENIQPSQATNTNGKQNDFAILTGINENSDSSRLPDNANKTVSKEKTTAHILREFIDTTAPHSVSVFPKQNTQRRMPLRTLQSGAATNGSISECSSSDVEVVGDLPSIFQGRSNALFAVGRATDAHCPLKKRVCFTITTIEPERNIKSEADIIEIVDVTLDDGHRRPQLCRPGKWRRSLAAWKRETMLNRSQLLEKASQCHIVNLTDTQPCQQERKPSIYNRMSVRILEDSATRCQQAFVLEQTDVVSTNTSAISFANESAKLRHSVSYTSPTSLRAPPRFDETSQQLHHHRHYQELLLSTPNQQQRRRRTSVLENSVIDLCGTDYHHPTADLRNSTVFACDQHVLDARATVLRRCGQAEPLFFADVYSQSALRQCRKIGEGVYGEVFMNKTAAGQAVVLKIIPIEGQLEINGEPQKKFDEILSEIVIAMELSSLRNGKDYMTSGFVSVLNVRCVQGRYPEHLLDCWELYRDNHDTENDHPEIFGDDQLYIVLELANAGQDLEAFQFQNAQQSLSAFHQTVLTLAVAEKKYKFEHRDLHWGNILLAHTDEPEATFRLNGRQIKVATFGVKVSIIDYTLSRMVYDGCVLFNDLSQDDELFTAGGDLQFDIYRDMKLHLANDWKNFEPFTNVLWLHYTIDKMINGVRYKTTKTRKHRDAIQEMMTLRDDLLENKSAYNIAEEAY